MPYTFHEIDELAKRHEKLAQEYAERERSYQFDEQSKDGAHSNPNCERARQSMIAHTETAAWFREYLRKAL